MQSFESYNSPAKQTARFNEISRTLDESLGEFSKLSKVKLSSEERHQKYEDLKSLIVQNLNEMEEILNNMDNQIPDYTINHNIQISLSHKSMFRRLDEEISEKIQRDQLFHSPSGLSSSRAGEAGTNYALAEYESARRATALVDRQIEIAMDTRNNLNDQQSLLGRSQWKLLDTNTRYQVINNLAHRIALRKRRDQYIVGGVIVFGFVCLLMLAT